MCKKSIWIPGNILNWEFSISSCEVYEKNNWVRAYELWERSRSLIDRNENTFDLMDGIINLKRALNSRLLLIRKIYGIDSFNFVEIKGGTLEILEQLGIIRPTILRKLMEIRNNIEHNDSPPPNIEKCKELVDILWYFLRSTDTLVQKKCTSIEGTFDDTNYIINFYIDMSDGILITTNAVLPENLISLDQKANKIKILINEYRDIDSNEDYLQLDTGKVFKGRVVFEEHQMLLFLKQYFSIY